MNILIIHNYYKIPGGEDTVVNNERILLEQHGHRIFLYTRNNSEMESYSIFRKMLLPFTIFFSKRSYNEVLDIIDKEKIDIIHVHNTVCVISPSVYYAAMRRKIPIVQTIHNFRLLCPGAALCRDGKVCEECIDNGLLHAVKYSCYRQSRINTLAVALVESLHKYFGTYKNLNYICLTDFNKQKLLQINNSKKYIDPRKIYVKPNFVSTRNSIVPYKERKKQIIYAGRLDKTKGIHFLLEAWMNISNYKLVICGTGPEEEWCKNYIRNNNLNNVEMLGFLENDKVLDLISISAALILPTQWYEGFPMVLVESFACGTPVLGSNIGNVGDIIIEGENGIHFEYNNPLDIVRAVNSLTDMSDSTLKISNELYSAESNYNKLMNIYDQAINNS